MNMFNYRAIKYFRYHFPRSVISWLFPSKEKVIVEIAGVKYECQGRYARVTEFNSDVENIIIQPYIFRDNSFYVVNSIESTRSYGGNDVAKSINMPDTITSISQYAFNGFKKVKSLLFPESVQEIGAYAFEGCESLKKIRFPKRLSKIEIYAFAKCEALSQVFFAEHCDQIESFVFDGCPLIDKPIYTDDAFVKLNQSFKGKYEIPKSVKVICGHAFIDCEGLTCISIPDCVTNFSDTAFVGCNNIKHSIIRNGELLYERKDIDDSYRIPSDVSIIGSNAFRQCDKITRINIPDYIQLIKHNAFKNCVSLSDVQLHDDVKFEIQVGEDDFSGSPFEGCSSLQQPIYNRNFFVHLPRNYEGEFVVPKGIHAIGCNAFENCKELEIVVIPDGVRAIGCDAFSGSGLYEVTLPDTIDTIYDGAFQDCGIQEIILPDNIKILPPFVFAFCEWLHSVILPKNLEVIGRAAFNFAFSPLLDKNTYHITIPDSVRVIDTYAFYSCLKLEKINMSKSLEYLGERVFLETQIKELVFHSKLKKIGREPFAQMHKLERILVPNKRVYDLIAKEYEYHDEILLYNEDETL